jgi:D-alanyl-D-alanine carboxypeptidase
VRAEVDLDAPVETYLPGLVRGEGIDGRNITVRQLLNHTSGLPDYIFSHSIDFTATRYRQWEPQELLRAGLTQPALSPPGTRHEYSNTNYLLAGMLIEKITGRTIGQEITSRIIGPLRLRDTYWPAPGEITIRARTREATTQSSPAPHWSTPPTRTSQRLGPRERWCPRRATC